MMYNDFLLFDEERNLEMKINRVKVSGFRNIDETELIFNDIIALVSLNNYGKSNLLKAINFGIKFISSTEKDKKRMMSAQNVLPLNKLLDSKQYSIEFECETTIENEKYHLIYGFEFIWIRNDKTGQKIIKEELKVKDQNSTKYTSYINRDSEKALYKSSPQGRCSTKLKINSDQLIINKLKAFDDLFYIEIIKRINEINIYIEGNLNTNILYSEELLLRTDIEEFDLSNQMNIPRVIYSLKTKYKDKYELLMSSFKQLFPQIQEINVKAISIEKNKQMSIPEGVPYKLPDEVYTLYVIDRNLNQPINFNNISDGAKRILLHLTSILIADIKEYSLIAIEEPENSIHPALLQSYLRVISQLKGDCNIILTSHSPYLLQYISPSQIYIGIPYKNGIAKFNKIKTTMEKTVINTAETFDMSTSDYIFDLLNGDDEDILELKKFIGISKDG